jgi:hypothetical protein
MVGLHRREVTRRLENVNEAGSRIQLTPESVAGRAGQAQTMEPLTIDPHLVN